jgi:hypothetical protein
MPTKLDDAFLDTIRRIKSQPQARKEQGMNTLAWFFLAERQMKIDELRCALSMRPGDTHVDEDGFPTCKSLLDCCLGLVVVDDGTSSVRLVHKSLQDLFERQHTQGALFAGGHPYITRTCLTYMGFDHDFGRESHLLFSYVNKYWGHHLQNSPDNIGLANQQILATLLKFAASLYKSGQTPPWMEHKWKLKSREGLGSSESDMIHYLAYFGLTYLIQYMLENGDAKVDHLYCHGVYDGYTPLVRAADHGPHQAARLLLEKGADIQSQGGERYSDTSLLRASSRGHAAVVQLLLENGANTESSDVEECTSLCLAALRGHKPVVQLLAEKGANLEAKTDYGSSPLPIAALYGRMEVVRYLIDKGAEIDSKDKTGRTPLSFAAKYAREDTMQLLLERGADPEAKDNTGRTAWDHIPE